MEDALQVWLEGISNRSEGTKHEYQLQFNRFLRHVPYGPNELRQMKYAEDQNAVPWERSHVENIVREYLRSMEAEGLSCSYQRVAYAAIRSFFRKNGLRLNMDERDQPQGEGVGSVVPAKADLRKLCNGTGSLKYRALILFLKDSGLRQSDVFTLQWKDLKSYGHGFYGFTVHTKKTKTVAHGFIGPEASETLLLYRQKRLKGTAKLKPETNLANHPIFAKHQKPTEPLVTNLSSLQIGDIIRRIGIEGLTVHGLRKFWEQHMKADRESYLKQMLGRKLTHIERAYYQRTPQQLFEIYKQHYDELRILEQPTIKTDELETIIEQRVQQRMKQYTVKITELTRQLAAYHAEREHVLSRLQRLEAALK